MSKVLINYLKKQVEELRNQNSQLVLENEQLKTTLKNSAPTTPKKQDKQNVEEIKKSAKEFDDLVYCNTQLALANEALADTIEQLKEELAATRKNEDSTIGEYKTDQFIAKVQEEMRKEKLNSDKLAEENKELKTLLLEQNEKLKKLRANSPKKSNEKGKNQELIKALHLDPDTAKYINELPDAKGFAQIQTIINQINEKSKLQYEVLNGVLFELKKLMEAEMNTPGTRDRLFIDFVDQNIKIHGGGKQIALLTGTNLSNRAVPLEKFIDKEDPLYQLFIAQFLLSCKLIKQNSRYTEEFERINKEMAKHGMKDISELENVIVSSMNNEDENDSLLERNAKVTETNRLLSAENTQLADHLAELSKDHSSLSLKLTEKDKQIDTLKKMNSLLKGENEDQKAQITQLMDQISNISNPITIKSHSDIISAGIVDDLRNKVSKLQSKVRQLKRKQRNEISELTGIYESQRMSLSQSAEIYLSQASAEARKLPEDLQKSNLDIMRKSNEIEDLRRQIDSLKRGKATLEAQLNESERKNSKLLQSSQEKEIQFAKELAEKQREDKRKTKELKQSAVWPFLCAANMVALEYGISVDDINDFARVMQLAKKDISNLRYFQQNSVKFTK
ncbi:hypothetical protein TVAG_460690 [Trichomonas vaginalis G3]|uniref:Uncharacterized protein n=1 Tax=Trichomonas vaginalis (strain ATCC PRA-98 / G3) TaxID=412133 RepID=A2DY43_TRIV3|nr:hypothetical protein TVAGG3_0644450 [Trichomonas vaginalis G3]EAY14652.1 hypothetical protein TVAG_460690 [Trichomonas vaginalis G3]KAI5505402.1 hypothetical protein TVAGG3_0644450 [Trichomonas vaginalis G3]|eukprot:XP_001326875.1 hypothetical protein [Trichomonas vaginalis G3]